MQEWQLIPRLGKYCCKKCLGLLTLLSNNSKINGQRWHCKKKVVANKKKLLNKILIENFAKVHFLNVLSSIFFKYLCLLIFGFIKLNLSFK